MTNFFLKKYKVFIIATTLLLLAQTLVAQVNDGSRYAKNSKLATGTWIKIKVSSNGIQKITYDDLKKWGITDPQNVQIYGYGGWMIDEDFSKPYIDDLPQVPVWLSSADRGSFAKGDYLLFYAKGDLKWSYNKITTEFEQTQNYYSSDSYYFITESTDGPLIMKNLPSEGTPNKVVTTYQDYFLHEKELENISETGREFYGENFRSKLSQDFAVDLPGAIANNAIVRYNFISRVLTTSADASLQVSLNGKARKENKVTKTSDYYVKATVINDTIRVSNLLESNKINLTYKPGAISNESNIRLNFIRVNYTRQLKPYGASSLFRTTESNPKLGYKIANGSSKLLVFNVTEGQEVAQVSTQLSGTDLSFTASNTDMQEYAMVDISLNDKLPKPTLVGKVENQNLHALTAKDMIIIVQPIFKKYAEELAKMHYDDSGLESLIVTPEDIYNEFSSGKPDMTAYRRFAKMFYDRANTYGSKSPQYMLLFGGGTYDNRFISNRWTNTDKSTMLLTFQSPNSVVETLSYVTDDYVGFLDDSEGVVSTLNRDVLDLGVGRLPVRSESEASAVVNKIKNYMADTDKGIWKNNLCFVADDAIASSHSQESELIHFTTTEKLTSFMSSNYPDFIINKVYEDSYEISITSLGARYPDVQSVLKEQLNSGVLFLNYVGHGSTNSWSHEKILLSSDIKLLNNEKLPLWITATCDFSRFDAYDTSGGELALLNPKGGAIALFSTVRAVYSTNNEALNQSIMSHILDRKDGVPLRLGDVLRNAKAELKTDANKLRFMLLGDPALRLTYAGDKYEVKLTKFNNKSADVSGLKIEALSDIVLEGVVVDSNGNVASGFNGKIDAVVFDSEQTLKTRGNTNTGGVNTSIQREYTDYTNTIYKGNVDVKDGKFTISFTSPRDILYTDGYGKMSFYAYDTNKGDDAIGSFMNYRVGGTNDNAIEENNPPQINKMYLNKESFSSGDKVNSSPLFYAEVSDDTGINLTGGIGHNISLTVDGVKDYNLTPYYTNDDNSAKSGRVQFLIPELNEGMHYLQFRVWDVWNNSQTASLDFQVVADYVPSISGFVIEGNPAVDRTLFRFTSDVSGAVIAVKYEVYSMTGALQWVHQEKGSTDMMNNYIYEWDLRTTGGSKLAPGIYVCRASITVDGRIKASQSEKLIVVKQ